MRMAATTKPWTIEELHRLPDDGNKYELVHGELFVTPPPSPSHEMVLVRLQRILDPYVMEHRLGAVFRPRAVFRIGKGVEVEPDLFVSADQFDDAIDWENAPKPLLVVEVLSRSTRSRDLVKKRRLYRDEARIPDYWIIDRETRVVHVVQPGKPDRVETAAVTWYPAGAIKPLHVLLSEIFSSLSSPND